MAIMPASPRRCRDHEANGRRDLPPRMDHRTHHGCSPSSGTVASMAGRSGSSWIMLADGAAAVGPRPQRRSRDAPVPPRPPPMACRRFHQDHRNDGHLEPSQVAEQVVFTSNRQTVSTWCRDRRDGQTSTGPNSDGLRRLITAVRLTKSSALGRDQPVIPKCVIDACLPRVAKPSRSKPDPALRRPSI